MPDAEYFKEYYRKNREKRLKQSKEWQSKNFDHRKEYLREYRKNNPEKWDKTPEQNEMRNAARRKKYAEDKEYRNKQREKAKEYGKRNPHIKFAQRLKQYGITPDDYIQMLGNQNGECAICGSPDSGCIKKERLHVDHCHTTGKVRGLLCTNCNQAIGKFKDSPELLRLAAMYIEKSTD